MFDVVKDKDTTEHPICHPALQVYKLRCVHCSQWTSTHIVRVTSWSCSLLKPVQSLRLGMLVVSFPKLQIFSIIPQVPALLEHITDFRITQRNNKRIKRTLQNSLGSTDWFPQCFTTFTLSSLKQWKPSVHVVLIMASDLRTLRLWPR